MPVAVARLTYEDIKDRPEDRMELVDGELIVSPAANPRHQLICQNLGEALLPYVRSKALGRYFPLPIHVVLEPGTEYEPDACFIAAGRSIDLDSCFRGAPDLAVEVISESNRTHDTVVKFRDYERFGVKEYWLVDPRAWHVRVFELAQGALRARGAFGMGENLKSPLFPELALPVADIFAAEP